MIKKRVLFILILLILSIIPSIFADNMEIFSRYDTIIQINKNYTLDVKKDILLRNVHDVGIVPGDIEFKIGGINQDSDAQLTYIDMKDRYGKDIKYKTFTSGDDTIISTVIMTPVLPGFEYKIDMKYGIEYSSTGFLFKNLELPLKEDTPIEIKSGKTEVILPKGYHLTYLEFEDNNTIIENNSVIWELNKDTPKTVTIEYSYMPMPFKSVRGSIVFWLVINAILIVIFIHHLRREIFRVKRGEVKEKKNIVKSISKRVKKKR